MKKIILNISDSVYEKFRFEALHEKKSIHDMIGIRLAHKPFDEEVEKAFSMWMSEEISRIVGD